MYVNRNIRFLNLYLLYVLQILYFFFANEIKNNKINISFIILVL